MNIIGGHGVESGQLRDFSGRALKAGATASEASSAMSDQRLSGVANVPCHGLTGLSRPDRQDGFSRE
jgi:hypothetical protein